ncbi:MAG TPA: hypothetical protein V6C97_08170 [Oculatellaceae cyanobacterium]
MSPVTGARVFSAIARGSSEGTGRVLIDEEETRERGAHPDSDHDPEEDGHAHDDPHADILSPGQAPLPGVHHALPEVGEPGVEEKTRHEEARHDGDNDCGCERENKIKKWRN